jgi:hypothetical protein
MEFLIIATVAVAFLIAAAAASKAEPGGLSGPVIPER